MKKLPELLCLLNLLGIPAQAAEPQPSPSPDAVTVYRLEALSPEFLTLAQVAYPLGLGYLLQGEDELGGLYMGLQGGMLLSGTLWGTSMGGSTWTQLLPNLSLGLWLISLTHVDVLARAKNTRLAQELKLSHEQVKALASPYPFAPGSLDLPEPRWDAKLGFPVLIEANSDFRLAFGAAPGLQLNYPLGAWLRHYTHETWSENWELNLELQGLMSFWSSSLAVMPSSVPSTPDQMQAAQMAVTGRPGPDLFGAPGLSSSLGLIYRTSGSVAWYAGAGWTTLWRGLLGNQATWNGVTAQGGLSLLPVADLELKLGLQLGFLGFSGGMAESPALIRVQPEISGSFVF
ncbi:MAG: hypothetical protein IV090_00690 [Candidatus Sericytochromatia bacterium]|nr:hypothetical protein [Candidatus Sericytochromatia bacterium]